MAQGFGLIEQQEPSVYMHVLEDGPAYNSRHEDMGKMPFVN